MKPIERRRTERFNLRIGLRVSLLNSGAREQSTETLNISAGGMHFATNLSLRRSTAVQLHSGCQRKSATCLQPIGFVSVTWSI